MKQTASPSRRINSRIVTFDGPWVSWHCNGHDGISRVRDVSLSGLFVETQDLMPVGSTAQVDFLVQEGQIRAKAVVRHMLRGRGAGLKFTAVSDGDRSHLVSLVSRLRRVSR